MNLLSKVLQRGVIFLLGIGVLWLIVTQIFVRLDERLPLFVALVLTYIISAYILLPQLIRLGVVVSRRGRIPRTTREPDGLTADPVNILLAGTAEDLICAFKAAGWYQAERLTIRTAWKMARQFAFNRPYPEAPFRPLYLFGRRQDYGFQLPVGNSPRKRHHVRFWAADIDPLEAMLDIGYWINKRPVDRSKPLTWAGSGSLDLGIGLTQLSYQISHRVDKNVDMERDFIIDSLKNHGRIEDDRYVNAGEVVAGKFVSDGMIRWARLTGN